MLEVTGKYCHLGESRPFAHQGAFQTSGDELSGMVFLVWYLFFLVKLCPSLQGLSLSVPAIKVFLFRTREVLGEVNPTVFKQN